MENTQKQTTDKKVVKMNEKQAKRLGVVITIFHDKPELEIKLNDGLQILFSRCFDMLPNVPIESYVQFAFAMYNDSVSTDKAQNS